LLAKLLRKVHSCYYCGISSWLRSSEAMMALYFGAEMAAVQFVKGL